MDDRPIDMRGVELISPDSFLFTHDRRADIEGVLIPESLANQRSHKLMALISEDLRGTQPLVVPLMDGANGFYYSLFSYREYNFSRRRIDLVVKSYEGTSSSGKIRFPNPHQWEQVLQEANGGSERPILLVEDIVDTARTLTHLISALEKEGISRQRIKIASLLSKPSRRMPDTEDFFIDYLGFIIPDYFVVGYGLDFDERYRELPDICVLKQEVYS